MSSAPRCCYKPPVKPVNVSLNGNTLSLQLGDKITKDLLYGEVRPRVEKDGQVLERGWLLPDGTLLRRSQLTSATVDPEGTPVEAPQSLIDGNPAELIASSFEKEAELKPVPLTRLIEFTTTDTYALESSGLAPGLYETTFNYRKGYHARDALVLVKGQESWLLVGQFKRLPFVGKTLAYSFFDAAEDEADEADPLDFSMM